MSLLHLLEPEETIGNLWHRLVGDSSAIAHHPDAAVRFEEVEGRIRIFFRGLGGDSSVEIKPATPEVSHHRLTRRQRLGIRTERVPRARYDGDRFSLPDRLDLLPERRLNEDLYFWLAAFAAVGANAATERPRNPYQADLARLELARRVTHATLREFPGLRATYARLAAAVLALRPARSLSGAEAHVESLIRDELGRAAQGIELATPEPGSIAPQATPHHDYKPFLPVPVWGEIEPAATRVKVRREEGDEQGSGKSAAGDGSMRRARRRKSDQIERKGGLIVHRFEKILTWTEFMNLHRDVEDDEEANARKAADDHDEIGVTQLKRKAATKLAFDLDLAPADVEIERLSDIHVYPEWDYRKQAYQPAHARVLERLAEAGDPAANWHPGPKTEKRIRAVRRQFEALRPKREVLGRQLDGHELDMDALIRSRADLAARGEGSDRIYRQTREQGRDLSVAVLVDTSRSTESCVDERAVIDIEKEALIAMAEGLAACGDACAIYAFSSLRRDRVFMPVVKRFDEPAGADVRARIGALKPGFYTRLGTAIRHVSAELSKRPSRKRLLIALTDGKPNDLDHYDGRYGVEDSRRAVWEARKAGHAVFGITVDAKAQSYFPRIFGANAFSILSKPERLTAALPMLYRHLVD